MKPLSALSLFLVSQASIVSAQVIFEDGFESPRPPNLPPEINSTPVTTANLAQPYAYDVDASDPDGNPLIYSILASPAGMTIDAVTGQIEWIPEETGEFSATVQVADGNGGFAQQSWTILVGGIPARCFAQVTSSDQFDAMTCNTAVDSTVSFTDGYIVPTGYYFMVTDISVGPFFTSGTPGTLYRGAVCERSEFSRSYCYEMRDTVPNWHSRHFTVPYVVIRPGRYPEGRNAGGTTTLEFQISGVLVTDTELYFP